MRILITGDISDEDSDPGSPTGLAEPAYSAIMTELLRLGITNIGIVGAADGGGETG